jgi:hypothetical protein
VAGLRTAEGSRAADSAEVVDFGVVADPAVAVGSAAADEEAAADAVGNRIQGSCRIGGWTREVETSAPYQAFPNGCWTIARDRGHPKDLPIRMAAKAPWLGAAGHTEAAWTTY